MLAETKAQATSSSGSGSGSDVSPPDASEASEARRTPPAYYAEQHGMEKRIEHSVVTLPLYTEPLPAGASARRRAHQSQRGWRAEAEAEAEREAERERERTRESEMLQQRRRGVTEQAERERRAHQGSVFGTLDASVIEVADPAAQQEQRQQPYVHKELFWLAAHLPVSTAEEELGLVVERMKALLIEPWIWRRRLRVERQRLRERERERETERGGGKGRGRADSRQRQRLRQAKQTEQPSLLPHPHPHSLPHPLSHPLPHPIPHPLPWRSPVQYVVSLYVAMPRDPSRSLYSQIIRAIGLFQASRAQGAQHRRHILLPHEALTVYVHLIHCPDDLGSVALVRRNLIIISGCPASYGAAGSGISLMRAVPRPSLEIRRMYTLSTLTSGDLLVDYGAKIFGILYREVVKRIHKLVERDERERGREEGREGTGKEEEEEERERERERENERETKKEKSKDKQKQKQKQKQKETERRKEGKEGRRKKREGPSAPPSTPTPTHTPTPPHTHTYSNNNILQSICVFLCYISLGPDKVVSLEGHTGVDGFMHLLIRRISVIYEPAGSSIYKCFPLEVLLAGLWRCGSSRCVDGYVKKMELLVNIIEIAIGSEQAVVLHRLRDVFRLGDSSPPLDLARKEAMGSKEPREAVGIGRV